MVVADTILPVTPERDIQLRGLALAALLHGGILAAILALDLRPAPEIPVFEVAFALPEQPPAPVSPAQQPATVPPAAEPADEPEPPATATAPPEAQPTPVTETAVAEAIPPPPPRPVAKPRRAEPAPAAPAASLQPEPAPQAATDPSSLASLPPAPAPPATAPAAQTAAPAVPPLQLYAARLRNLLAVHQEYPRAARQRRQEGIVRVALTIDRSGNLAALRVYESSAASPLDDAALAMARRAAPFPPPPLEPQQMQAVFIVPVRFALEE